MGFAALESINSAMPETAACAVQAQRGQAAAKFSLLGGVLLM